jgi:2'-hydroxyisoflavone reductase
MNALILGGTRFVGRHIAEELVAAGHPVTVFNRGESADALPRVVERVRGDRDLGAAGLAALKGRAWDACVDVSGYTARQVRASAELLRGRVGRYVFISAVSVYGDPVDRPVREDHARVLAAGEGVTEVVGEMYGRLKVTCENIVEEVFGEGSAALRPQIVVGRHDESGRYMYWVERVERARASGERVVGPGDGNDHVQVIDARDVARFARIVIEEGLSGAFNLAGPRMLWGEFLRVLGAERVEWKSAAEIRASGVTEFELPLFREERGARSGLMDVSSARARAAGLVLTEPGETARWVREGV